MTSAAIYGLAGLELTADEKSFFRDAEPWGFILFARNIDRPKQVSKLCVALRDLEPRIEIEEELRLKAKASLDKMLEMASGAVGKGDLGKV